MSAVFSGKKAKKLIVRPFRLYSDAVYYDLWFYYQGIAPILPIFREGILNGTPELKEQAANGLGEVISLTSAAALRPFVVNITGPLIRILGDRFSWNVKVAVLQTLGLLLGKVWTLSTGFELIRTVESYFSAAL